MKINLIIIFLKIKKNKICGFNLTIKTLNYENNFLYKKNL